MAVVSGHLLPSLAPATVDLAHPQLAPPPPAAVKASVAVPIQHSPRRKMPSFHHTMPSSAAAAASTVPAPKLRPHVANDRPMLPSLDIVPQAEMPGRPPNEQVVGSCLRIQILARCTACVCICRVIRGTEAVDAIWSHHATQSATEEAVSGSVVVVVRPRHEYRRSVRWSY